MLNLHFSWFTKLHQPISIGISKTKFQVLSSNSTQRRTAESEGPGNPGLDLRAGKPWELLEIYTQIWIYTYQIFIYIYIYIIYRVCMYRCMYIYIYMGCVLNVGSQKRSKFAFCLGPAFWRIHFSHVLF